MTRKKAKEENSLVKEAKKLHIPQITMEAMENGEFPVSELVLCTTISYLRLSS